MMAGNHDGCFGCKTNVFSEANVRGDTVKALQFISVSQIVSVHCVSQSTTGLFLCPIGDLKPKAQSWEADHW